MWKDEYKIGVEHIDRQHRGLFIMTEHLIKHIIKTEDPVIREQECIKLVQFLKGYSIQHFTSEEEYMDSIGFYDAKAHKEIHKKFIDSVMTLEQKMLKTDFSMRVIKEFAGFLTAWLIYHVSDADQKLNCAKPIIGEGVPISTFVNCFAQSASGVLKKFIGMKISNIIYAVEPAKESDILIQIGLIGEYAGSATFIFPRETTLSLIKAMAFIDLNEIDEIAYSALSEISNIISGNAATIISGSGKACDIKPPKVIRDPRLLSIDNGFQFETECGKMSVCISA